MTEQGTGLRASYDGDFEQYLAEKHNAAPLKRNLAEALITYCGMFHGPFFNIENTSSTNISDEELYRWVSWCIFYGRSKDEYPLANQ